MEDADAPVFIDDVGLRNAIISELLHSPIGYWLGSTSVFIGAYLNSGLSNGFVPG
jgi:hypothetical protein